MNTKQYQLEEEKVNLTKNAEEMENNLVKAFYVNSDIVRVPIEVYKIYIVRCSVKFATYRSIDWNESCDKQEKFL